MVESFHLVQSGCKRYDPGHQLMSGQEIIEVLMEQDEKSQ